MVYPYNREFEPPAPTVPIRIASPASNNAETLEALLDSGADISVVPTEASERLGLLRVDRTRVVGFGAEATDATVYSASIGLEEDSARIERVVSWGENYAIIGRDIMNRWRTTLDGPSQTTRIE